MRANSNYERQGPKGHGCAWWGLCWGCGLRHGFQAVRGLASGLRVLGVFAGFLLLSACWGQAFSFNIDLDVPSPPELGGGAPSDSFGGAANQPGYWNEIYILEPHWTQLRNTGGHKTGARMRKDVQGGGGTGIAFRNTSNTGDFARLLNDALEITGWVTWSFEGLASGPYDVFTYAVQPQGGYVEAPIWVYESGSQNPQVVTGPMPGNSFGYLVTHSVHRIVVTSGRLTVYSEYNKSTPDAYVNGFQIVQVPEVQPALVITLGLALLLIRMRLSK